MFFEDMGITYLGPVNGHDINALLRVFKDAKRVKGPVLVHVLTEKERAMSRRNGILPDFTARTPSSRKRDFLKSPYHSQLHGYFSTVMCKLGKRNEKVVAITAAMPDGTGLKRFRNMYPERFFDVGIAEEHAVTFAAGLAAGGYIPVVAIYSSFYREPMTRYCTMSVSRICRWYLP